MDCSWIGWCALRPEAQAAWVQAIGSVLAILVAAFVPWRIAARQATKIRAEQSFRARSLAFVLLPHVRTMSGSLSLAKYRWAEYPSYYDDDAVVQPLTIPSGLSDRLLDLHVLGEASRAVHEAIVAFEEVKEGVHSHYGYDRYGGMYVDERGEEHPLPEPDDVDTMFAAAKNALTTAASALNRVLGH